MACIDDLASEPTLEKVQAFARLIKGFQDWPTGPHQVRAAFVLDSEFNFHQDAGGGYLTEFCIRLEKTIYRTALEGTKGSST